MSLARHLPRFRDAERALDVLAARERWPRAAVEAYQLDRLNRTWREAVAHVPHFRRLRADAGLPDAFGSLDEYRARVPVLEKPTVARDAGPFLSERARPGAWHRTSGSTGTPLRVYRAHADHRAVLRAKYRFYAGWG